MCVEIAKLFLELFLDNCYKWQGYEVNCRQANPYCAQDVIVQPVLFVTSKKITTFAAIISNNFRMWE